MKAMFPKLPNPPKANLPSRVRRRGFVARRLVSIAVLAIGFLPTAAGAQSQTEPVMPELWNDRLEIGAVPGLTTTWHPAPIQTAVPLGATLRFRVIAPYEPQAVWTGAREIERGFRSSTAEHRFDVPGVHTVSVTYFDVHGEQVVESSILEAIDTGLQPITVSGLQLLADAVEVDPANPTASSLQYLLRPSSIAALRVVGDSSYRTSINRRLILEADVEPAAFAPLIEWRFDGEAQQHLGSPVYFQAFTASPHLLSVGPPDAESSAELETYRVSITSHRRWDEIAEGTPVTFTAVTDPPGFEGDITWISTTRYGSSQPALGEGPEFTVVFETTTLLGWRWVGVRADNTVFRRFQPGPVPPNPPAIRAEPGQVVISLADAQGTLDFRIDDVSPFECLEESCRSARFRLSLEGGEPISELILSVEGTSLLSEYRDLANGATLTLGSCHPFGVAEDGSALPSSSLPCPLPYPATCSGACELSSVFRSRCDPTLPDPGALVEFVAGEGFSLSHFVEGAQETGGFHQGVAGFLEGGLPPAQGMELIEPYRLLATSLLLDPLARQQLTDAWGQSGLLSPLSESGCEEILIDCESYFTSSRGLPGLSRVDLRFGNALGCDVVVGAWCPNPPQSCNDTSCNSLCKRGGHIGGNCIASDENSEPVCECFDFAQ